MVPWRPPPCSLSTSSPLLCGLEKRFEHLGQSQDLDEAISLLREILYLQHAAHPDRCTLLHNLLVVPLDPCKQLGRREDVQEAVLWCPEIFELLPTPLDQSDSLNNLERSLTTRYQQSG